MVVVVVTFVVHSAPTPNPVKSTVPPTRGRTFVPKSTVFLTVVVTIPGTKVVHISIISKLVIPKSKIFLTFVVLIPSWTVLPVSITANWVVPKSRAEYLVVPKSTTTCVVVPKSIALWTIIVE